MKEFYVSDYGAIGDGNIKDTKAIQEAIDACLKKGGGRVVLESGKVYYSGTLFLKENVDFHLEQGAMLKGSADDEDYFEIFADRDVVISDVKSALLYGYNQPNITISGQGCIDGNDISFMGESNEYHTAGKVYPRPAMILLEKCDHLTVKDVTLQNAPFWTLHPVGCNDVLITGIRILNKLYMANCDGIDPDHCKNVRISNCHIEAADDCIVFKATREFKQYGPVENIIVTGCTLISTSAAIKFGTEGVCDFKNIVVSDCIISKSNRGISLQIRDGGNVENVLFQNIIIETRRFQDTWWGKAEPIYVTSIDRNEKTTSGVISNVKFSNIICKSENGIFVYGQDDNRIKGIAFKDITVLINKESKWDSGIYDLRPNAQLDVILDDTVGIYMKNAQDVYLDNVEVKWGDNKQAYYGSATKVINVKGLEIGRFKGVAAHHNKADMIIR